MYLFSLYEIRKEKQREEKINHILMESSRLKSVSWRKIDFVGDNIITKLKLNNNHFELKFRRDLMPKQKKTEYEKFARTSDEIIFAELL